MVKVKYYDETILDSNREPILADSRYPSRCSEHLSNGMMTICLNHGLTDG